MLLDSYTKIGGIFSTITVLLAVLYHRYTGTIDLSAEIPNILDSLRKAEQKVPNCQWISDFVVKN